MHYCYAFNVLFFSPGNINATSSVSSDLETFLQQLLTQVRGENIHFLMPFSMFLMLIMLHEDYWRTSNLV